MCSPYVHSVSQLHPPWRSSMPSSSRLIRRLLLATIVAIFAAVLARFPLLRVLNSLRRAMTTTASTTIPKTRDQWRAALDDLPSTPDKIPAFFFGHGSPILQWPESIPPPPRMASMHESNGPNSPLAQFLQDLGPHLLEKYKPKGILVFSAHWETAQERLGTSFLVWVVVDKTYCAQCRTTETRSHC